MRGQQRPFRSMPRRFNQRMPPQRQRQTQLPRERGYEAQSCADDTTPCEEEDRSPGVHDALNQREFTGFSASSYEAPVGADRLPPETIEMPRTFNESAFVSTDTSRAIPIDDDFFHPPPPEEPLVATGKVASAFTPPTTAAAVQPSGRAKKLPLRIVAALIILPLLLLITSPAHLSPRQPLFSIAMAAEKEGAMLAEKEGVNVAKLLAKAEGVNPLCWSHPAWQPT